MNARSSRKPALHGTAVHLISRVEPAIRSRDNGQRIPSCVDSKQIDVSFPCACPVVDHELRYNIVKIAVDLRCDGRVNPQTNNIMTKFMYDFFSKITNCQTVRSRSLRFRINYKFKCLFAY